VDVRTASSTSVEEAAPYRQPPEVEPAPRVPAGATPSALPRAVDVVSWAVVAAGVTMAFAGSQRTGVSWDEPFHVMRLRNHLEHGWFALDWSVADGASTTGDSNTLVYAPVTMLLLHGLAVLVGIETWGTVATTPEAYAVRHLGVVLIGLAGTAAAAATTRILLDSWRWALVTAAALLALPMWTGHVMFNIKDVPVATGYSLMTLALVAMVSPSPGRGRRLVRVVGLASGITLMVGTRPAMASAVVVAAIVVGVGVVVARSRAGRALGRDTVAEVATGGLLAGLVLVVVYPDLFTTPLLLVRSADQSSSFRESDGADFLYIPFYLVAQFPLLLQGLAVLGLVVAVRVVRRRWRVEPAQAVRLALVAAQLSALPIVAIAKGSELYNGLRQLLFAMPAWAVLVTVGLAHALAWAGRGGRARSRLVGAVAAVSVAVPMVDQAMLFPYQYTYYNLALDVTGADVQSDYWRTSVPELLPDIPTDGPVVCGPTRSSRLGATDGSPEAHGVDDTSMLAGRYSSDSSVDCRIDPLGPLASLWAADDLPRSTALPHDEFYVVIDRDHGTPANCTRLAQVSRERHWREIAMSYVARCRLEPPLLDRTVAFARLPGENMDPPLWAYAADGWTGYDSTTAIDAAYAEASLTFALPDTCASGCSLVLDGDAPPDLAATVNDRPSDASAAPGRVTVPIPADVEDAWVTFRRTTGEPLGLRVRSIRVVPSGTV
jgi:hypothetical protein